MLGYQSPILMLMKYRRHRWKWQNVSAIVLVNEGFGEKAFDVLKVYGDDDQLLGCAGIGAKTNVEDVVRRIEANGGTVVREVARALFEGRNGDRIKVADRRPKTST